MILVDTDVISALAKVDSPPVGHSLRSTARHLKGLRAGANISAGRAGIATGIR